MSTVHSDKGGVNPQISQVRERPSDPLPMNRKGNPMSTTNPAPQPSPETDRIVTMVLHLTQMAAASIAIVPNINAKIPQIANNIASELQKAYNDYKAHPDETILDHVKDLVNDALNDIKFELQQQP
jgi:hypothetical protein